MPKRSSRMRTDTPDMSDFFEVVCAHFLARTGRGLVLSSRDTELILEWHANGATAACICSGVDEAVDSLNRTPRNLHACRAFVDARIKTRSNVFFNSGTSSSPPAVPSNEQQSVDEGEPAKDMRDVVLTKLLNGQSTCHPDIADVYRQAARLVQDWEPKEVPTKVIELNTWMFDTAFSSLPEDEQKRIDDAIVAQVGNHLKMMSQAAKKETLTFRRQDVLVNDYGLIDLQKK